MDGGEARAKAAGARARGVRARARAVFVRPWRSGLSTLLHTTGPLPRPSLWAWTADASLALLLAACTVGAALSQDMSAVPQLPDKVVTPVPGGEPVVPVPPPPPLPSPMYPGHELGGVHAWQLLLAALTALPLLVRRRYPLTAFWAVIVTTMLFNQRLGAGDTTVYTFLTCLVAAYSAAVHSPYRLRALTSLVAGAALIAAFVEENFPYVTPAVIPFLVLLGVGLAANALHTWKQRVHALQEQQEAATRLAVEHERSRIARELHDVVTHHVSVMVIQAGAARKVMDAAPDRAREALLAVEAGGRTAMTELRHVMGLLTMTEHDQAATAGTGPTGRAGSSGYRAGSSGSWAGPAGRDGPSSYRAGPNGSWAGPGAADAWAGPAVDTELAPQPGLDRLPALTSRVRASGVPVELSVTGTPSPLSPGADLAAYRVVQEALTNAVKHAAGARVRVTVDQTPTEVRLEITDTGGTPAPSAASGTGRGLLGLRERLAVHGGTLRTGPRPTGGYRVQAVIPLDDAPSGNRPDGNAPTGRPRPAAPPPAYPTAAYSAAADPTAADSADPRATDSADMDPPDGNPSLGDPPVEDPSTVDLSAADLPAADRPTGRTPAAYPPAGNPPTAAPPDGPPVTRDRAAGNPPAADRPGGPTDTGNPPPGQRS
ncbi:histidine kinase [Streptomyces sp. NBC_01314]|nr:histidine kinase [Streptomyces sp. NBC_01314]